MKYAALRHRLTALAQRLPGAGTVLRIEGGLPRDFAPAKPLPPGHELASQHAAFAKAAHAPNTPSVSDGLKSLGETPNPSENKSLSGGDLQSFHGAPDGHCAPGTTARRRNSAAG